jgi:hypothetical protein
MGATFKCWLIANFEIVMFFLFFIILGSLFMFYDIDEEIWGYMICFALISFVCTCPTNKGVFQFGRYFLILIFGILITVGSHQSDQIIEEVKTETSHLALRIFWINFAIASIIAIFPAIYTYHHMEEVVSRRMLYRNSNVSLFEFSWKYTLDRFCNITVSILYYSLCISLFIFAVVKASQNSPK